MLETATTTSNENWSNVLGIKRESLPILIIGNNPIEMTSIYNFLIGIRSKNYLADVCFDIQDSFDKITKGRPEVIFVDDNLSESDINKLVRVLNQNEKTKHIKIIVLKSSNWNYQVVDNAHDYILKDTINADNLDRLIEKSLNPAVHQFA